MVDCPDCKGTGGDTSVDISDRLIHECPLCDGTGQVEEGTKGWIERLFLKEEK